MFYEMDVVRLLYLRKFVRQRAHSGGLPENLTFLGATFRGNPGFRKLRTIATESIYISCKFYVDIIRGYGDIASRILAGKRK